MHAGGDGAAARSLADGPPEPLSAVRTHGRTTATAAITAGITATTATTITPRRATTIIMRRHRSTTATMPRPTPTITAGGGGTVTDIAFAERKRPSAWLVSRNRKDTSNSTALVRRSAAGACLGDAGFFVSWSAARGAKSNGGQRLSYQNSDKLVVNHVAWLDRGAGPSIGSFGAVPTSQLFCARRRPALMETLMKKTLTALLAAA